MLLSSSSAGGEGGGGEVPSILDLTFEESAPNDDFTIVNPDGLTRTYTSTPPSYANGGLPIEGDQSLYMSNGNIARSLMTWNIPLELEANVEYKITWTAYVSNFTNGAYIRLVPNLASDGNTLLEGTTQRLLNGASGSTTAYEHITTPTVSGGYFQIYLSTGTELLIDIIKIVINEA